PAEQPRAEARRARAARPSTRAHRPGGGVMRTRWTPLCAALLLVVPVAAGAREDADGNAWEDGDVHVELRVAGGSGAVVPPGVAVPLSLHVDADAWVAVYAIDTRGTVRLLFPRVWCDDGRVAAGECVRLDPVAFPIGECTDPGIVYVQAVASPEPFDWER